MKIIFSPTKSMNKLAKVSSNDIPEFVEKAKMIKKHLKSLDKESLNKILKVNDKLLEENYLRYQNEDFNFTSKAILTYSGLSFKNLNYETLEENSVNYLNDHLRIISGLYGILKPEDGIINYRLEMNYAYIYWDILYNYFSNEDFVINLASKEYSKIFNDSNFINISFCNKVNDKLVEKSTNVKMMRGKYLRYLSENNITNYDDLKLINIDDFKFSNELSQTNYLVYVKEE